MLPKREQGQTNIFFLFEGVKFQALFHEQVVRDTRCRREGSGKHTKDIFHCNTYI